MERCGLYAHKKQLGHGACIHDNFIYSIGGYDGRTLLESVLRYDTNTNIWRLVVSMPTNRWCHGSVYRLMHSTGVLGKLRKSFFFGNFGFLF